MIDDAILVSVSLFVDDLILDFCYNAFSLESGGFELTSTITLLFQENGVTKCTTHPHKKLTPKQMLQRLDALDAYILVKETISFVGIVATEALKDRR